MEFDTNLIRQRLRSAVSVSLAGMLTPFALGSLLALVLVSRVPLFGMQVATWEAMLFMGTAITIGIYAIFGGFILGTAMPRGAFAYHLHWTLEPIVTNFLFPLFFVVKP